MRLLHAATEFFISVGRGTCRKQYAVPTAVLFRAACLGAAGLFGWHLLPHCALMLLGNALNRMHPGMQLKDMFNKRIVTHRCGVHAQPTMIWFGC